MLCQPSQKLPLGTLIWQGGEGSFQDLSATPESNQVGVWMFNRLCDFKRDLIDKASSVLFCWILAHPLWIQPT